MKRVLLGLLLLIPLASCRFNRLGTLRRVLVVEGPGWVGLLPKERQGLRLLVEDLAETAGATVLPAPAGDGPTPAGVLRIALGGSRSSLGLRLQARLQTGGGPERDVVPAAADPKDQLRQLLAEAGLRSSHAAELLPKDSERLLPLAAAYAAAIEGTDQEAQDAAGPAAALALQEPACAPAALARAQGIYRRLLTQNPADLDAQVVCGQSFETALSLLPGYPRAAQDAGRFHTDTGNQRRALELLFAAEDRWPRSPRLQAGLIYAARTTGLLDGARAALREKERLEGIPDRHDTLPETAYLYLGEWDRFDASLGSGPGERPEPLTDFYRGYLRLLQGRQGEALANFRAAARTPAIASQFQALAQVYELALDGHRPEALLALRLLARARQGLRVPDGEFTFKLAEAYGFLGSLDEAMDAAQTAFSQGFGCTAWYERTPFLAALRDLPRWRALDSHLRERQALLETQFPAQRFDSEAGGR